MEENAFIRVVRSRLRNNENQEKICPKKTRKNVNLTLLRVYKGSNQ